MNMSAWRCPACSSVLPVEAIDPKGIVCTKCGADLRVDQPYFAVLGLSGLVIPLVALLLTHSLRLPWILLVVLIWPFSFGLFLMLIRRVTALPLTPMTGPFNHFTLRETKFDSPGKNGDESSTDD